MRFSPNTSLAPSKIGEIAADAWRGVGDRAPAHDAPGDRGPVRVELMRLPSSTLASDCCSVMMAIHGYAIRRNLDSVLTSLDPEGPHQLRVALRRLRVVLRTFSPILRTTSAAPLAGSARRIGSIVSELRDADVLIDELMGPALAGGGDARQMKQLESWRQEVRGRVRARLIGAGAQAFAAELAVLAGTSSWHKRKARKCLAADLVVPLVGRCAQNVAEAVARMPQLRSEDLHDVRKEVKALRYAVDIGDALSLNRDADLLRSLKRAQDALGYVNDTSLLEQFSAPLRGGSELIAELRNRLLAGRADVVASNKSSAATRLANIKERCAAAMAGEGP